MANEMPPAHQFTNLTRKVMEYSEQFAGIVEKTKTGLTGADWDGIEAMVDTANFQRVGQFLTDKVETIDWPTYKGYITQYAGYTEWEGTLRRITEGPGVVIQELEERNTRDGVTDVANTVMIYGFNAAGKLDHLDVYVAHIAKRPAG
jgi:hypothetical protein